MINSVYMDLKDTYNKIAADWHKDHKQDNWWVEATDKFISLLPTGGEVLDVGCGAGTKAKYLVNKGLQVLGIDIAENLIAIAKTEVPAARFLVMDMKELGDLMESFDGVFAQASLLHIPKQEISAVIKSLSGKLKSGGYFYVAVKEIKPGQAEEEVVKENDYGYEYERFFSYYTLDEIKKYCIALSMEIAYANVASSGRSNWLHVIAKKK